MSTETNLDVINEQSNHTVCSDHSEYPQEDRMKASAGIKQRQPNTYLGRRRSTWKLTVGRSNKQLGQLRNNCTNDLLVGTNEIN